MKALTQIFCFLLFFSEVFGQRRDDHRAATEKDFKAYLFAYFTGNEKDQEAVHFAISPDGYQYRKLNQGRPVMDSETVSSTGGVRDPHILRKEDGSGFYMVLTDMVSRNGWDSNRAMVLSKTDDLIHWSHSVVNLQERFAGNDDLLRVWAPQTIYDSSAKKYLIYWSMKHGDGPDKIYYAYANAEFTDLDSEPKQLFFPKNGKSCIDGDIMFKDGLYHLFYKTEGHGNGIKVATTNDLTSGRWNESADYKQQTSDAVEGSCVFKLTGQEEYILMYDVYGKGSYQFTKSKDLENFEVIDQQIDMDFHPRHGTVIPITMQEWQRLTDKWGTPDELQNISFDHNPVLSGYHADPEILYSEKTGRYYLYPTSDGFDNWSGYYFKAFSSDNLIDWQDEGIVLNLKTDVPWAGRNAWAPAIIEKKIGNDYRYFYYYSGAQKIGVAVGDDPAGPFTDIGKALIQDKPEGVKGGQEIDPDVFYDPQTGKDYLYWGNGYLAVAELEADMISIHKNSTRIITPDKTFREGIYVFYRKGLYYFLWSENDTRSEDYRVRYGTSKNPRGPIEIPESNLVIQKSVKDGIFGTGHNSVIQIPGTDQWYIVYHRFSRPEGIEMGERAGYHREVCIDEINFDKNGHIIMVVPTTSGIHSDAVLSN